MTNHKLLAVLGSVLLLATSAFAADKACCASTTAANEAKQGCSATFAQLDLNADQKAKMEKLAADCDKAGCNKQSMTKMEKSAKTILSKQQFATWKASCAGMMPGHTQS